VQRGEGRVRERCRQKKGQRQRGMRRRRLNEEAQLVVYMTAGERPPNG
jgi:hypothetical protein